MRLSPRPASFVGLALGAALIVAACSSAESTPVPAGAGSTTGASANAPTSITLAMTNDPTLGAYLTGQGGMTLYVLTKDPADLSTCSLTCATNWPPLAAASGATITGPSGATGTFSTIMRSDGVVQVTYNQMPLYYFSGDSAAGDTKGQGTNGVWFVAPLSGSKPTAGANAATPAAPSDTPAGAPAPGASASVAGY